MGLAASQARLLHLTARQHSIEYKSQMLQAQKLQMANESDTVYNNYLTALNATKIQAQVTDLYNGVSFADATLAVLENGAIKAGEQGHTATDTVAAKTLLLQDIKTGNFLISSDYAKYLGLTDDDSIAGTLDEYLTSKLGKVSPYGEYEDILGDEITEKDETQVKSFKGVSTEETSPASADYNFTPQETGKALNLTGFAKFKTSGITTDTGAVAMSTIAEGTKLENNSYTVSSAADLAKLQKCTFGNGVKIVLDCDIENDNAGTLSNWTGISGFTGTFNGNGHTITGLNGSQGLFATTNNAIIENVGLEDITVNGSSATVGGLIGSSTNTDITNCYTKGTVTNSDTTASGRASTNVGTGGLVGYIYNGKDEYHTISNVFAETDVIAENSNAVGGLIGNAYADYTSCSPSGIGDTGSKPGAVNYLDIMNTYATGDVKGNTNVGGLIGQTYYDFDNANHTTKIIDSVAAGDVTGNTSVGGFIGYFAYYADYSDHCEWNNCQTISDVNYKDEASKNGTLGLIVGTISLTSPTTYGSNAMVNMIDCSYIADKFTDGTDKNYFGNAVDQNGTGDYSTFVSQNGSATPTTYTAIVPNLNVMTEEILATFVKTGAYSPLTASEEETNQLESKIHNVIDSLYSSGSTKLYTLANDLYNYLSSDSNSTPSSITNLQKAVNGEIGAADYISSLEISSKIGGISLGSDTDVINASYDQATVTLPSMNDLTSTIASAYQKYIVASGANAVARGTGSEDGAEDWARNFLSTYTTDKSDANYADDSYSIARINEIVTKYANGTINASNTELQDIMAAVGSSKTTGTKYTATKAASVVDDVADSINFEPTDYESYTTTTDTSYDSSKQYYLATYKTSTDNATTTTLVTNSSSVDDRIATDNGDGTYSAKDGVIFFDNSKHQVSADKAFDTTTGLLISGCSALVTKNAGDIGYELDYDVMTEPTYKSYKTDDSSNYTLVSDTSTVDSRIASERTSNLYSVNSGVKFYTTAGVSASSSQAFNTDTGKINSGYYAVVGGTTYNDTSSVISQVASKKSKYSVNSNVTFFDSNKKVASSDDAFDAETGTLKTGYSALVYGKQAGETGYTAYNASDNGSAFESAKTASEIIYECSSDENEEYKTFAKKWINFEYATTDKAEAPVCLEVGTGKYNVTGQKWVWDDTDTDVQKWTTNYNLKRMGYVIIGDDNASADYDAKNMDKSSTWLSNMLNEGVAQLVDMSDFNQIMSDAKEISEKYSDKPAVLSEKLKELIQHTSVANETSLQEVSDEQALKVQEATYEADIAKINAKEKRIDTQLSALETERSAILQEEDELKTVAKDNVNLTFKLFS